MAAAAAGTARVSAADGPGREPESPPLACPTTDAVWASVSALVPEAAPQLASAKPRVQIEDRGARYRVRVTTPEETLEREYVDPARECARRARFAAEFIVLALMPPRISERPPTAPAPLPDDGGPASGGANATTERPTTTAGQANTTAVDAAATAPPSESNPEAGASAEAAARRAPSPATPAEAPARPQRPPSVPTDDEGRPRPLLRIELSGAMGIAPPLGPSPTIVAWGGQWRAKVGPGPFAAVVGGSYWPAQSFSAGLVEASIRRVPVNAGLRLEAIRRAVTIDVDLTAVVAFERYAGLSLRSPSAASAVAPGIEAAIAASIPPRGGFAPFVAAHLSWFPVRHALYALPAFDGTAPPVWLFVAAGVAYSR